ncbi:hypothetical protein BgAZ_207280 [Babesia gibsoni]|uniref:Uncharacterized protein n=1 Tax=Babesia gibsoni TaxID=33632 RepID=A0AAD8PEG9_BABGI|nr:hypothetical protein BgAZ_207280 [Babesia gibsoni]
MSKLFEVTDSSVPSALVSNSSLLHLHIDRLGLLGISNLALYASLTSALLLDILSVVFVLLPFSDNGLVAALKILGEVGDPLLVQHLYAQLLFMAVLFAFIPISLYKRKTVVRLSLYSNILGRFGRRSRAGTS